MRRSTMLDPHRWLRNANARVCYHRCNRHVSSLLLVHQSSPSTSVALSHVRRSQPLEHLNSKESHQPNSSSLMWRRLFHASPTYHLAVSRRRKRDPAGILERKAAPLESTTTAGEGLGSNNAEREKSLKAMTTEEFRVQSSHLISRIHAALVPLGSINPQMVLSRGRNEVEDNEVHEVHDTQQREESPANNDHDNDQGKIMNEKPDDQPVNPSVGDYLWIDLGPVHGQYTIQADEAMQIIILLSPISGQRVYRYDNHESESRPDDPNRWMCTDDGHVLEGLLVRDLIRQIQGVPNL